MTKAEYMQFHEDSCKKLIEITKRKNADYAGSGNDPFANFRQIGALIQQPNIVEVGFLTRMSDKMSRIGSFVSNGTLQVKDESVEDTLMDIANYAILFAGYLRSKKAELDKGIQDQFEEIKKNSEKLNQGYKPSGEPL